VKITDYLKTKNPDLPDDWEVYSFSKLPKPVNGQPWEPTHVELQGAVPRLLKSGKNKGKKTWRGMAGKRMFIVPIAEVEGMSL
jgi:hypothetical protein